MRWVGRRSLFRSRTAIVLIIVLMIVVALIGLSPLALNGFGGETSQWERLSFIGQTYGATSAILSVFAVIGVVATLAIQARETRLVREDARRTAVGELLRMAMEDPDLDECWGPVPPNDDARARRQLMYTNMIISEWQMSFETKALGETRLRAISREMFEGRVGRSFWENARELRIATSETRRARRFHQILDEEYHRARPASDDGGRRGSDWRQHIPALIVALGALVGAVGLTMARRRTAGVRRRSSRSGR